WAPPPPRPETCNRAWVSHRSLAGGLYPATPNSTIGRAIHLIEEVIDVVRGNPLLRLLPKPHGPLPQPFRQVKLVRLAKRSRSDVGRVVQRVEIFVQRPRRQLL